MRVYIIGMPASGKSTVGKELAKKMKYKFVDLDKKIVKDNSKGFTNLILQINQQ